jgi:hypothetical protein
MLRHFLCTDAGPRRRWGLQPTRHMRRSPQLSQRSNTGCIAALQHSLEAVQLFSTAESVELSNTIYGLELESNAAVLDQLAGNFSMVEDKYIAHSLPNTASEPA